MKCLTARTSNTPAKAKTMMAVIISPVPIYFSHTSIIARLKINTTLSFTCPLSNGLKHPDNMENRAILNRGNMEMWWHYREHEAKMIREWNDVHGDD